MATRKRTAPVGATTPNAAPAPVQQQAADPWVTKVQYLRGQLTGVRQTTLRVYHELGGMVRQLETDPNYYGGHRVEELSAELAIGPDTLRACRRFHIAYSVQELDQAVQQGISWYAVSRLLAVPQPSRTELQSKYAAGQLTSKALVEACTAICQAAKQNGTVQDRRGQVRPAAVFTTVKTMTKELSRKLVTFRSSASVLDPNRSRRDYEAARKTADQLRELRTKIDEALAAMPAAPAATTAAAAQAPSTTGPAISAPAASVAACTV